MDVVQHLIERTLERRLRLLVIGEPMLDVWHYGKTRIGPEGCLVFRSDKVVQTPGGAWNAAAQLDRWNVDAFFPLVMQKSLGVAKNTRPKKIRFFEDGILKFRLDSEDVIDEAEVNLYQKNLLAFDPHSIDGVLISDYDKGLLTEDFLRYVIEKFKDAGIPVVVDAKKPASIYQGAIVKGNLDYWKNLSSDERKYVSIVTMGQAPPGIVTADGLALTHLPNYLPVPCVNSIGSGDCFAAHLLLAIVHGFALHEAMEIAHSAGRVYVQHEHARPPWPHEIRKDFDPLGGKVLKSNCVKNLRESIPGRIVFTNGVFRLPHAGHAWLLQWAKKQGDILVVGINDDESARVAKLVKPDQFCLPLSERLEWLQGLSCVDWIIPFSEKDPCAVMRDLHADFLVKGSEYQGQQVPGHDLVNKDVLFAPESPYARHSSDVIEELRK